VAGDLGVVLNWLGQHGIEHVQLFNVDIGEGVGAVHITQLDVVISQAAGAAVIDADGTQYVVPLGF
jgi:hypothetical protein